ncbi:hypothetical protein SAMN04487969_101665 [Paenibacillus algorifonticola]|uniref:Uncharacterized protein n=2 Tax=Paenibacillus algorifonticola TaxID=684063 RepID=A0A1I1YNB5_9BACL|nr:hypothetical protein SAMN04487969_101665 [Paenibacillus algorifonticola]
MLKAEMDTHLGYGKHKVKAKLTPNSGNRKSRKTVMSEYSEQEIALPQDSLVYYYFVFRKIPYTSINLYSNFVFCKFNSTGNLIY